MQQVQGGRRQRRSRRVAVAAMAVLALLLLVGTAPWWLLDAAPRQPAMPGAVSLQPLQAWWQWQDPRRLPDGARATLRIGASQLQLLGSQAARLLGGAAETQLARGQLQVRASLPLWGRWANLALSLQDGDGLPVVQRLQLGPVVLPRWLADPLFRVALFTFDRPHEGTPPLRAMALGTRFSPDSLQVSYVWRADLLARVSHWLVPPAQLARVQAYQSALVAAVRAHRGPQELPSLVMPLFSLARDRSLASGQPAAENRAVLLVLAAHVAGRPLASWLPEARAWPPVPQWPVLLDGREDFPIHLLVSAALAAEASGPLADALGLAKELGDAHHGSGFSFNDYAINRAGTRLGQRAVQDPVRLQQSLSTNVTAQTLMPDVSDLPEFLSEREFTARFGGVGAPAYEALTAQIEARVAAMPLWQH